MVSFDIHQNKDVRSTTRSAASAGNSARQGYVRPAAVAGTFYPADRTRLKQLINTQLDYGRALLKELAPQLPAGVPKAVIVPHAGYVYSGTTAALAYALLERGRGSVTRAVIVGPTHRVAVRGVACSTATAFATPLGEASVDVNAERRALGLAADEPLRSGMHAHPNVPDSALIVNDPTHAHEHAVEVQIPFLQTIFGPDLSIVPLNAGDASPEEVGDVLRSLWGGPETVIVISSDLSHYHPEAYARQLDDETIDNIAHLRLPIHPRRACGAYPINGLLDVLTRGLDSAKRETSRETADSSQENTATPTNPQFDLRLLCRSTSGDDGVVALAGKPRPAMDDPDEPVVGYASFAVWQSEATGNSTESASRTHVDNHVSNDSKQDSASRTSAEQVDEANRRTALLSLARAAIRQHLGLENDPSNSPEVIISSNPWLDEPGASFVTLTEHGQLRGCIGTLEAYRALGKDVADHAVDAAAHDPRFFPVSKDEYPLLHVEVSVLGKPSPLPVQSRTELEQTLRPGIDGLILTDRHGRRATFLPQVWEQLQVPHDFVSHLLAKAGIAPSYDWHDGEITCERYEVSAYAEH
ncbi:AmmeMemoRadiSam system protein B [Bifidobacterium sp. LC6]|uniref:AmmeMemoRadiSam system protein B n=1 Tax=Bifidobacterium colobi TaxID=2809026 RepID=A0ABS5UVH6_9BIFI|nr:AmmeMemoRadiSam system protein B [Bifidobacterium colobi]MBT1175077.1 AmmeMemoRadiSam system protein B [Bifidobacterium colobi]